MEFDYQSYRESCWQEEDSTQLQTYLEGWRNYHGREIEVLKEHQVAKLVLPKDYFGWYEGHPAQRIYKLDI